MFSPKITKTDAFLDMPQSAQLLYFHFGMEADDDGFVASPRMIMRIIGSSLDDLKLLQAKKFIIIFENGVCVIKHWRIHNQIRKKLYTETKYQRERAQLFIRENGSYTLTENEAIPLPKGHFTIADALRPTQGRPPAALGKDSIGKDSIEKNTPTPDKSSDEEKLVAEIIHLFIEVDPKNKNYYKNKSQREAARFLLDEYGFDDVQKRISFLPKSNKVPYFPTITTPCQLRDKWVQLEDAVARAKTKTVSSNRVAF